MTATTTAPPAKDAAPPQPGQLAGVYAMDPTQVQTGQNNGPGLWVAPAGTQLPVDCKTPFATPWEILGYISDDGPTIGQSADSNEIVPWQSMVPIRTVITKRQITMKFTLWQLNEQTLAMYFDVPVPTAVSGLIDMQVRTDQPQQLYALAVDTLDGLNALRIGFTRASLSDAGDMAIKRGEAVPLECTLSALDDSGVIAHVMLGPGS
jgi:hypothetical protein